MQIAFPFEIENGLVAGATYEEHIRQMIQQVLFTAPGERCNRIDFGCGLGRLLFESPNSETITATQSLVQGALQQWLGDLIQVKAVRVEIEESTLRVAVQYFLFKTQQLQIARFER